MRKLLLTTAAVAAAIGLAGCWNSDPDTLTDKRDGQKYQTVMIGGKRWIIENLNYQTDSSWCYNDDTSYCKKYGRLYAWNAANKACPARYHLPSRKEWNCLVATAYDEDVVGKTLKYDFRFLVLPGGYRSSGGNFNYVGDSGYWWTATVEFVEFAHYRNMNYEYHDDYARGNAYPKNNGLSVRCVADNP